MRRRLNVRLVLILLVSIILFGAGVHTLHGVQVERSAVLLQQRAERAEKAGNLDEAEQYWKRYLGYEPADTEALIQYGQILDQKAESYGEQLQAMFALERVLRREPDRTKIRRQVAELATDLERYTDAEDHLWVNQQQGLLREAPEDGELLLLLGRCREAAGRLRRDGDGARDGEEFLRTAGAAELYAAAIEHAPGLIDAYVRYARLLRDQLEDASRASTLLDEMVAVNDQSARAYLERARFHETSDPEDARKDIARALELAPHDVEVLLVAATQAIADKDLDRARTLLEDGIKVDPTEVRLYQALAGVEVEAGRFQSALARIEDGLKAIPDQPILYISRIETLILAGEMEDPKDAEKEFEQLRLKKSISPAMPELLKAQLLMRQERWSEAVETLELSQRYAANLTPESKKALLIRVDLLLAQCYQELGDLKARLAAYRRVLDADRRMTGARVGMAATLEALGRIDEAILVYRQILPEQPTVAPELARLEINRNRGLPEGQRDWNEVDHTLNIAARQTPNSSTVTRLKAATLTLRGQLKEARTLLEEARDTTPDQVDLWVDLADVIRRQESPAAALAVLDKAQARLGDRAELRLARIIPLLQQGGDGMRQAFQDLEKGLDAFPPEEQADVLHRLANAYFSLGELDRARPLWERVVQLRPDHVEARLALFDFALRDGDLDRMRQAADAVRKAEGEGGIWWRYCDAACLVGQAEQGDLSGLARAAVHLELVAQRQPRLARVPLLQARIDEKQQDSLRAIEHYQKAIDLGDTRPEIIGRFAGHLVLQGRDAEAEQALLRLPKGYPMTDTIAQTAATLALRKGQKDRAIELARQAVPSETTDYRLYLWLGKFLAAAGQSADAEAAFRRATELGGEIPETWITLVEYLVLEKKPAEAEAAIEAAKRSLPPALLPSTLADCYDRVGRREAAGAEYLAALEKSPEDIKLLNDLVAFYMKSEEPLKAEPLLRRIINREIPATDEQIIEARRTLVLLNLMAGGLRRKSQALELVEANLKISGNAITDQRLKAIILKDQPNRSREAIRVLEEMSREQELSKGEKFLLAGLYLKEKDWHNTQKRILSLLAVEPDNPQYLEFYVIALLTPDKDSLTPDKFRKLRKRAGLPGWRRLSPIHSGLPGSKPSCSRNRIESRRRSACSRLTHQSTPISQDSSRPCLRRNWPRKTRPASFTWPPPDPVFRWTLSPWPASSAGKAGCPKHLISLRPSGRRRIAIRLGSLIGP